MMIHVVNSYIDKGNNYVCVSRPRRFGKTIAGNMLSAYYSKGCDSRELQQIKDRNYFDSLSHYHGNLLFVGINYDAKEKTHDCKIERFSI